MSLADDVAQLEQSHAQLERELQAANEHINDLEHELYETAVYEDMIETIADVRRGIVSLEELYEKASLT